MAVLSPEQREELQAFLKDWLRHAGRSQSDLRRALRVSSLRMPVLIDALDLTYSQGGIAALVERLCAIEAAWHSEDQAAVLQGLEPGSAPAADLGLEQLDLLLQEIRQEHSG